MTPNFRNAHVIKDINLKFPLINQKPVVSLASDVLPYISLLYNVNQNDCYTRDVFKSSKLILLLERYTAVSYRVSFDGEAPLTMEIRKK